jgi:hypothetical protein
MGEIADAMLDGDLCEGCGVYLGRGQGFARRCRDCQRTDNQPAPDERVPCPTCGKRVKFIGLTDHKRAAHGVSRGVA